MFYHEKEGVVFMAQVDHLSGEQLGYSIGRFYDAGAKNVEVIPSITKKNRPSYVIFIDCKEEIAKEIEDLIPQELGVGGWHVIDTIHRYLHNEILKKKRYIWSLEDGRKYELEIEGKLFENGNLRPEHDSVISLQEKIVELFSVFVPYAKIYHVLMDSLESAAEIHLTQNISIGDGEDRK